MDDRSERLRKRRKRSTEQPESHSAPNEQPSDTSSGETPDADSADGTADSSDTEHTPIKETQTGTYMYLPDGQVRELRRLYNVLKAEYEFEYDEEFEKNRHFYPLVIQYGLDSLDGADISEIRAYLDDFYD
jgi:hypothetical protein